MLSIGKQYADEMVKHSLEDDPNECCGILAGKPDQVLHLYRITNTARSPYRYEMSPQELLNAILDSERQEWEFVAFYHSHTHSPAYPSMTDVRMALQSGYLEVYYVLVSLENKAEPGIRAFRIDEDGAITEHELRIC